MADLLTLQGINIRRGDARLAHDVNYTLPVGGLLLLTGPNGSGKTSFLRAVAGLLDLESGTITRHGELHWLAAQPLAPSLETPRQYLTYQSALMGKPFALIADVFGITGVLDIPLNKLSTGWRQRVKLSRLVAADRPLWLLDEPSDGLDAAGVAALQALVKTHIETGGGVIIATHDPQFWVGAQNLDMAVTS